MACAPVRARRDRSSVSDHTTGDGRPATVRFEGPKLAEPSNLWVAWYGERYHRVELPQVGASLEVPGF